MVMKCNRKILRAKILGLIILEVALVAIVVFSYFNPLVNGDIGENVTVVTNLTVGNVFPEILNVSVQNGEDITLIANDTKTVYCESILRDYNNDSDFQNLTGVFFDATYSSLGDGDDNNTHYTNNSCNISTSFGSWNEITDDDYLALGNCTFEVYYYANASDWNCSIFVNDTFGWSDRENDTTNVLELLAVGLPDVINYGTVNATFVSDENATNVTNYGNVDLNLSLKGYSVAENDGWAMNCTLGSVGAILLGFEKYNLTVSHDEALTYTQFEGNYTNLTSSAVIHDFSLYQRKNDTDSGVDDYNTTYWRIYVPLGVAGTCNGTIEFGATTAAAS